VSLLLPERGRITDALVEHMKTAADLVTAGILVGDGVAPDEAGWPKGQANVDAFVASTTVETLQAVPNSKDTIHGRHSSWIANYGLRTWGGVRTQADNAADKARAAALGFRATTALDLQDMPWKITEVMFAQLAPVNPVKGTDPPLWEVIDIVQIWLERKRSAT
jgi:hypothetical protein